MRPMIGRVWGSLRFSTLLVCAALPACEDGDRGAVGLRGADGPKGPDTSNGAFIRAIEPRRLFVGESGRVVVSLDGFRTGTALQLAFGEGITLGAITPLAESPNASAPGGLVAVDLTIEANATPGLRDVTVKQGASDGELVATELRAFAIEAPLTVTAKGGSATPGGLVRLALHDRSRGGFVTDRSRFDVTASVPPGAPGLGILDFPEIPVSGFFALTASDVDAVFLVDPATAPGSYGLVANNGTSGTHGPFSTSLSAVQVTQGTKLTIEPGSFSVAQTLTAPYDSKVFRVNAPSPSVVQLDLVGVGASLDPVIVGFAPNGQIGDAVARTAGTRVVFPVVTADTYDVVVFDRQFRGTNTPTSAFSFGPSITAATLLPEVGTAHGTAAPQSLGAVPATGALVVLGTFGADDGIDLYKITRAPTDNVEIAFRTLEGDLGALVAPNPSLAPDASAVKTGGPSGFLRTATHSALSASTDLYIGVGPSSPSPSLLGTYVISIRKVP